MNRSHELITGRLAALAAQWSPPALTTLPNKHDVTVEGDGVVGPGPGTEPRVALGRTGAIVLVIVAAIISALLGWRLTHGVAAEPLPAVALTSPGPAVAGSSATAAGVSATVVVHVAGKVRHPGLVELPAGARVADALEAAGGLRKGAKLGATNLAALVADGQRIEIGTRRADAAADAAAGASAASSGTVVDLNTATAAELDSLPGIGPVTAAKILAWRSAHQRFTSVDELTEVPGIGPKTLAQLRPHVRV